MNIVINRLTLRAFRSINKSITIDFKDMAKGLVFVSGLNEVEPDLGSNGAGKSTIIDGLCWTLFGKTSVGLKAGMVHCWNSKLVTLGSLSFTRDGVKHTISRMWKPNVLKLDKESVSQERLEQFLDVDYYSFLYSVYISQFGSKFFDLDPSSKLKVFTSILESTLNRWSTYSDKASKLSKVQTALKAELREDIARLEGQLSAFDVEALLRESEVFESKKSDRIAVLKQNLKQYQIDKKTLTSNKETYAERASSATAEVISLEMQLNEMNREIVTLRETINTKRNENSIIISNANRFKEEITELKKLQEERLCPTCKQPVPRDVIHQSINSTVVKKNIAVRDSADRIREIGELNLSLQRKEALSYDKAQEIDRTLSKKSRLDNLIAECNRGIDRADVKIDSTNTEIQNATNEVNPYLDLIERDKAKIRVLKRVKKYAEEDLEEVTKILNAVDFWKRGFKEIRLMVLDESIKELEIQINNNLQLLGLPDWTIELAIESETQRGNLKREFTVMVNSPTGGGKIPLEVWSGGEGQRLRLSGTLGLMDFIHNRRNTDWNIEYIDEPTQFLSESGVDSLLEVLYLRAKRLDKIVFLADHRQLSTSGKFSGVLNVVKDSTGTKVEYENQ